MTYEEAKKNFPPIFAIYDRPTDFPQEIVVRTWYGLFPEPELCIREIWSESALEHIRQKLFFEFGVSCCLGRNDLDDSKIIESWV